MTGTHRTPLGVPGHTLIGGNHHAAGQPLSVTLSIEKKSDNSNSSLFDPRTSARGTRRNCASRVRCVATPLGISRPRAKRYRWLIGARAGGVGPTDWSSRQGKAKGRGSNLAEFAESGVRSGARRPASPPLDRPVGMLDCPLHDLGGRLLAEAWGSHRRLQEWHVEFFAVLRLRQQAGKNHQLHHPAYSPRYASRCGPRYAITSALESRRGVTTPTNQDNEVPEPCDPYLIC
jgi:hypothetical protein